MLDRAFEYAKTSDRNQKHAAIIVKGGRILAMKTNKGRNHPDIVSDAKTDAAIHAEVAALRACPPDMDLHGATIYIARAGRRGVPLMSKPCPNCQDALRARGIRKVIYTVDSQLELC